MFTEILVEINIEGLIYNGKSETKFSRTYSFYEFRSSIQHRQDLYTVSKLLLFYKFKIDKKLLLAPSWSLL